MTDHNHDYAYLIVVDNTNEFKVALDYTARLAHARGMKLFILKAMDQEQFHHWSNIEAEVTRELRIKAEEEVWDVAKHVQELTGDTPALFIKDMPAQDAILEALAEAPEVKFLILGANAESGGPGPLVSYFSGKGLSQLTVPLVVVPGNLAPGDILPI